MTATPALSAAEFAAKWRDNARRENAASQEHFIDLCRLLGVPTPNEADPTGEWYTFEAGVERTSTGPAGPRRRVEARALRLGVQGRPRRPRRRLPPAARLPRGPREPARARRQRHGPDRGPHQLHRHPPRHPPRHARRPRGRRRRHGRGAARAPRRHARPRDAAASSRPPTRSPSWPRRASPRSRAPCTSAATTPRLVAHHLNRVVFCLFAEDARLLPEARPDPHDRVAARRPRGVRRRALRPLPA